VYYLLSIYLQAIHLISTFKKEIIVKILSTFEKYAPSVFCNDSGGCGGDCEEDGGPCDGDCDG